jgi:hypothetical protein
MKNHYGLLAPPFVTTAGQFGLFLSLGATMM